MIDFNTSQLTWIVIGACSIGGTGYLTLDGTIKEMHTKIEVMNVKTIEMDKKLEGLHDQLTRIENKLDQRK